MSRKQIEVNTGQEQRCPLDDPEARLTYKNTEGYADPTCFFALCNVMRGEKARKRAGRLDQNHARDAPKPCHAAGGSPAPHKSQRKRFNTQVIHYDERGDEI